MENIRAAGVVTSFYKITMPSVIRENRLVLPKKFSAGYGNQLANTVKVSLPDGACWDIGLKRSAYYLSLEFGWKKFMKHYSVRFGYLLWFKYKGNSEFDLHIFDITATEITYPLTSRIITLLSKRKQPSAKPLVRKASKKVKWLMFNRSKLTHQQNASSRELVANSSHGRDEPIVDCDLDQAEDRAFLAATMYKTDNPSFIVKMRNFNVESSVFYMPLAFAREHLHGCSEFIELQVSDNKKWTVRLLKYRTMTNLGKGWSRFVKDNGLEIGDVCVFELIHANGIFKVSVFHA